jgi:Protein of unknown function (DUF3995)
MKARRVHARELPVSAEQLGRLIDGLGGEDDRLWPTQRWPTTPFELDGPLAVGTTGRQGQLRQLVDEYEPGRQLVFRFAPGLGLAGTHGVAVEPLGADRSRLTHTLQCRVEPKMLPLFPILIRQHDALVEDLLDRAELATTGRVARPAHWPASVRIANAAELRVTRWLGKRPPADPADAREIGAPMDRLARIGGVLVPAALAALAAVHAAWALGWRWPGGSDQELAERLLSSAERDRLMKSGGSEVPPTPAIWGVALALLAAAGTVGNTAAGTRSRVLRLGAWGVSGVLLARAAIGIADDLHGGIQEHYQRLDLMIYSPLCLALGTGAALVARRAGIPALGPR